MIPKANFLPRGRSIKMVGKWKKGLYERGPATKRRRTYTCAIFQKKGNTRAEFPYGQLFDNTHF